MTTAAAPTNAADLMPRRALTLRLDAIDVDDRRNDRVSIDTDDLATSMAAVGQLCPIIVRPHDERVDRAVLVAGYRRLAAAKRLGWTEISAVEIETHDEPTVDRIRAIENVVRAQLDPLAEILAVAAEVKRCDGDMKRAAQYFGRSEAWIRDRAYVAKFSGKARRLVAEGKLPLAHARAIARVVDDKERDALAEDAAGDGTPNRPPMALDKLEMRIGYKYRSLERVPWQLNVAFAGLRACDGCASNSATDPLLFEGTARDPSERSCSNGSCFARKERACEKGGDTAAAKALKQAKGKSAELTISVVRDVTPPGLKPESILRRAKRAAEGKSPAKAQRDEPQSKQIDSWRFENEWYDILRKARRDLETALAAKATSTSVLIAAFVASALDDAGRHDNGRLNVVRAVVSGNYDAAKRVDELKRSAKGLERLHRALAALVPHDPDAKWMEEFGLAPIESRVKYVARRVAEAKKALATKEQAKKPAPRGRPPKSKPARHPTKAGGRGKKKAGERG